MCSVKPAISHLSLLHKQREVWNEYVERTIVKTGRIGMRSNARNVVALFGHASAHSFDPSIFVSYRTQ